MDANFFHYSIYDRFIMMDLHVYRQPCAYVYVFVNFFFKKLLLRNLLTGFLPNFTGMYLR